MLGSRLVTAKTLIPDSLLAAKSIDQFEDWTMDWTPTTGASKKEEMSAMLALHRERFVRHNVSSEKFKEWLLENPRTFTTRREQEWLARKAERDSAK